MQEIFSLLPPYHAIEDDQDLKACILRGGLAWDLGGEFATGVAIPPDMDDDMCEMFALCCSYPPQMRPSAEHVARKIQRILGG